LTKQGEQRFREIESEALRAALETNGPVSSRSAAARGRLKSNRALINNHHALTVWLDAPFELLLGKNQHRGHLTPVRAVWRGGARSL